MLKIFDEKMSLDKNLNISFKFFRINIQIWSYGNLKGCLCYKMKTQNILFEVLVIFFYFILHAWEFFFNLLASHEIWNGWCHDEHKH